MLLSEGDAVLMVMRGACLIRNSSRARERAEAGSVLLVSKQSQRGVDARIARALALVQSAPAQAWTVERLARAVGLSRAVFARRFVTETARSPVRYVTELRLALAASYLEQGEASLAEIAARVGYGSEFALGRAFKRHHGVAPGVFRRLRVRASLASAPLSLAA